MELEFGGKKKSDKAQEKLNAILDLAVDRFNKELTEEVKEDFKGAATKFIRTYSFVLQICQFADIELHKLYVYLNYLLKKLPRTEGSRIYLADDVALEYYRNEKVFEGSISLEVGAELPPSFTWKRE